MPSDSPADEPTRKPSTSKPRAAARPRAGIQRKTKAEREEYARKEAERAKERDTSEVGPSAKTPTTRGRGGARGGRGGAVVHKTERTSSNVVSGVFGSGSGNRIERGRGAVDVGFSEALDGGNATAPIQNTIVEVEGTSTGRTGGSSGVGGRGRVTKAQGGDVEIGIERDEDLEEQPRRDIEKIWISSDEDEDEIVQRKGKQRRISKSQRPGGGLRPVRAAIVSNVDTIDDTAIQKQTSRDEEMEEIEPEETRAEVLPSTSKKDPPSSPELSKKPLRKVDNRNKDPRISTETIEEKAERLRLNHDIDRMREAFLHTSDTDDTVDSKEEEAVFGRTDHDRMFLFQLPPLVPQLRQYSGRADQNNAMEVDQVQVKVEDAAALATLNVPADSSQKQGETDSNQRDPPKAIYTADADRSQRLADGFVGKLRIHKSGKVSLDWGGTDMEVRYGTEVDFLQDVICVEDDPSVKAEGEESAPKGTGKAYAMGQINRKMVLIPDWGKLYA